MTTAVLEEIVEKERDAFGDFGPWHREWLMLKAPRSVERWLQKERDRQRLGLPPIVAARQGFQSLDLNDPNTSSFTARNNSSSEMCIIGDSANGAPPQSMINQYCAIPANDARAGKVYLLKISGIHGTTGTPTLTLTPRWGNSVTIGTNVTFGASAAHTLGSGVSAKPFWIEFECVIRTAPPGATQGTASGHGMATFHSITDNFAMGGTGATIDTSGQGTAGCGLQMGITFGTPSASNTLTVEKYLIASLN